MEQKEIPFPYSCWKHIFLVVILAMLVYSVRLLIQMCRTNYPYEKYGNLIVVLMLLFNHIAFYYTKSGWPSKVMKTVAISWLVFGSVYIYYISPRVFH